MQIPGVVYVVKKHQIPVASDIRVSGPIPGAALTLYHLRPFFSAGFPIKIAGDWPIYRFGVFSPNLSADGQVFGEKTPNHP